VQHVCGPAFSHSQRFLQAAKPKVGIHPSSTEREAELSALLDLTQQTLFDSHDDSERVGQALDGLFGGLHWQKTYRTDENGNPASGSAASIACWA